MEREFNSGNVNGILRKTGGSTAISQSTSKPIDLLVFGYACKLFRDDNKAREIDHGKHLIPWMGDSNLKIDRYDVRGALYDLTPYEPPPGGYGNRIDYLSADEQRAEQLCEEERYLFLYNNETDFILQQEEDAKRLNQKDGSTYNEVEFEYDNASKNTDVQHGPAREDSVNSEEVEQMFKLPVNFLVPPNIQLPETMKQHAIIEKTARFIASHGVQMEILLKAKQCNNAQFEFLAQNSILNPYYKYVTNAIKNGVYPNEESVEEANNETIKMAESSMNGLVEDHVEKPHITIPTIKYKPSANCAYTQLISKIKGVPIPVVVDEKTNQLAASESPEVTPTTNELPNSTALHKNSSQSTITNSIVKTSSENQSEVELLQNSSALALAQNYSSDSEEDEEEIEEEKIRKPTISSPEKLPTISEADLKFPLPTENLKNIIDKTATYVIKNGRQFEDTLRTKSVERFAFLLPDNKYYPYYMYKVTGDPDAASKEQKTRKAAAVAAALISKKGLNIEKTASPVSFSIKCKEESTAPALQTVLPQEPSDDDEESPLPHKKPECLEVTRNVPEHVQKAIKLVESQLMARNVATAFTAKPLKVNSNVISNSNSFTNAIHHSNNDDLVMPSKSNRLQLKNSKAELERNAIYEQQQQNRQKEIKKAEEKVKDKLAQIAREKLGGLLSKEKQLQLERKRKAMAFLNHIKGNSTSKTSKTGANEQAAIGKEDNTVSEDSDCSVHSIPITSYGPEEKTDDEMQTVNQTTKISSRTSPDQSNKLKTTVPTSSIVTHVDDDDDIQVINDIEEISTHQRMPLVKNYKKEAYSSSRSRSRSRVHDNFKDLIKRKKYRNESSDSRSSSYSSNSDAPSSYTSKRDKSKRKESHLSKSKVKTKKYHENNNHHHDKSKRSRSRHRTYSSKEDQYDSDEHYYRYERSSHKRDNKIPERSSSHRSKEKLSKYYDR